MTMSRNMPTAFAALTALVTADLVFNAAHAAGSDGPGRNFIWLAVLLLAANIAGRLVERARMPGVLGELLVGVVLGNLYLAGINAFEPLKHDAIMEFVAELGVVILLFQIGLESSLKQMREVGARALAVAIVGVLLPFVLGTFVAGPYLLPGLPFNAYLFLGATLTATSVGITGRVFQDLGRLQMREAQIVLGAAVIDDVLGLVILAVVTSLVQKGAISAGEVGGIIAAAIAFLAGSIMVGRVIAPWISRGLAGIDAGVAMKLALILSVCLTMAWLAEAIGLAPIVGAFAGGLVLEPVFLAQFDEPDIVRKLRLVLPPHSAEGSAIERVLREHAGHHHHELLAPLGYFFVPVFFVYTGMQVQLTSFFDPATVAIALGMTVVALVGKIAAGYVAGNVDRALVGWGMVPRGEVGLIFAMVGKQLGVVSEQVFAVIVIMVILTTVVTPIVLVRLLRKHTT